VLTILEATVAPERAADLQTAFRNAAGQVPQDSSAAGDGLRLAAIGAALGLGGAVAATRLIQSMLYGVSRFDAISFPLAATAVLVTSLIARALPMVRATGIDPSVTLRAE
jgi:hypothetical protein